MAGKNQNGKHVTVPEIWNGSGWRSLDRRGAQPAVLSATTFVAPNAKIFYAGELGRPATSTPRARAAGARWPTGCTARATTARP